MCSGVFLEPLPIVGEGVEALELPKLPFLTSGEVPFTGPEKPELGNAELPLIMDIRYANSSL